MNKEQIKQLALTNGFKLKEQHDGSMDLNPYVYEFADAIQKYIFTTPFNLNEQHWIHVQERMPEYDTPVLAIFNGHIGIFTLYNEGDEWFWARCHGYSSSDNWGDWLLDDDYQSIKLWQPLPDLPKQ